MTRELEAAAPDEVAESTAIVTQPAAVVTRMVFNAPGSEVWKGLLFYEDLDQRPPLHLRLLLPVPIRTEGRISGVGSEVMCIYEGGHLLKRITKIEPRELYEFEVAEQDLSVGGGMRLCGGRYGLHQLSDGRTEVSVSTRYVSNKRPRWLWAILEAMVCHSFHRHILRSMRRAIESH